jgi:hypothetical protein
VLDLKKINALYPAEDLKKAVAFISLNEAESRETIGWLIP